MASYFLIVKDSYPKTDEFNLHTLSSKIDNNNSQNKDLNFRLQIKRTLNLTEDIMSDAMLRHSKKDLAIYK
jgi:hypothetical protein